MILLEFSEYLLAGLDVVVWHIEDVTYRERKALREEADEICYQIISTIGKMKKW